MTIEEFKKNHLKNGKWDGEAMLSFFLASLFGVLELPEDKNSNNDEE